MAKQLTEEQKKQIQAANEEDAKRRAAMYARYPLKATCEIVQIARTLAEDFLGISDPFHEAEEGDVAAINATAHTLAMVMVTLHTASKSGPFE
jgi:hypothetical protein